MKTGVSGAAALSSSSVGSRRSWNWCSVKPPTTRTHCGGGVRAACAFSIRHGVGEAAHAVPAQLHIVVEPAADDVHVAVDQARDHPPAAGVDHARAVARKPHDLALAAHGEEAAVLDRDRLGAGSAGSSVVTCAFLQDQVGGLRACDQAGAEAGAEGAECRRPEQAAAGRSSRRHRSPHFRAK